ncbi:hypothetical protein FEM48_Zijuj04G0159400 [Ziziphus jujuba var. spinosa]|uniref:Glycosylphosphatidylinositol anchor attachment 1 protein-like n=1 Tax=Ziziphus jujuba var. spinosa TaxID=714518 RepID=A0A978VKT2_ZIZJJ|nr:hypothetical protein FEM48_Zijuj04G0159400 [Ziziphus jujuba var. spinosa]
MSDLGAEVNYHKFQPQAVQFHPLHFFSGPDSRKTEQNISCSAYGTNVVGIIRAPSGDGKEAIVLVTPFNSAKINQGEALSLGIAYSVFSLLTRVTWLAKDLIWLVADSQHGEYAAVAAWLKEYHTPLFTRLRTANVEISLVIKVVDKKEQSENSLSIYAEASNGQMPNLDLINIVNYLAALGVPTGPHGAFCDYQVDAITLEISSRASFDSKNRRNEFLLRCGRLIEGVIRSVNNLLEKFHQSFFLYLLTSPGKFVSVGVYLIIFALLVAPVPMVTAPLYADANNVDSVQKDEPTSSTSVANEPGITLRSWKWINAAKKVFIFIFIIIV